MADLADLIARLEAAEGPDRALNEAIAFHVQWRPQNRKSKQSFAEHEAKHDYATAWIAHSPWRDTWAIPDYTGSLDSALPWEKIVTMVYCNGSYECQQANAFGRGGVHKFEAIARRITALKAREAGND